MSVCTCTATMLMGTAKEMGPWQRHRSTKLHDLRPRLRFETIRACHIHQTCWRTKCGSRTSWVMIARYMHVWLCIFRRKPLQVRGLCSDYLWLGTMCSGTLKRKQASQRCASTIPLLHIVLRRAKANLSVSKASNRRKSKFTLPGTGFFSWRQLTQTVPFVSGEAWRKKQS
jgi:hypothetical protein